MDQAAWVHSSGLVASNSSLILILTKNSYEFGYDKDITKEKLMLVAVAAFSGISVDNLAKAREFYVDTLGLKLSSDTMGLELELPGGGKLFVYERPGHQPATYTVLNFVVENIDETVDHLANDHGIVFERYPEVTNQDEKGIARGKSVNMGPDIAWFTDPAGNILSVLTN